MAESSFILNYLLSNFNELEPVEFYRNIFPKGELEANSQTREHKYHGIAVELIEEQQEGLYNYKRSLVYDDLETIKELITHNNFTIISPISYIGNSRATSCARYIYAIAIDLDGISELHYLEDLFYQIDNKVLPKPTYIISSGTGIHLYYHLKFPLPCFSNVAQGLSVLKKALTLHIWNKYTTSLSDKPQIESLFQGFRMVGTKTKVDSLVRAFKTGDLVTIEYLNSFVNDEYKFINKVKGKTSLARAKELYPKWYEKRIEKHLPKQTWTCKKALYDWWLNRIKTEAQEGHRYYCILALVIYGKKCGLSKELIKKDAYSLLNAFDNITKDNTNHFTSKDIESALQMYNEDCFKFPVDTISNMTNIPIKKNKRNYRSRQDHLKYMRTIKKFKKDLGEPMAEGRPKKDNIVIDWRFHNRSGTKAQCIKETGLAKNTVYKYWKLAEEFGDFSTLK